MSKHLKLLEKLEKQLKSQEKRIEALEKEVTDSIFLIFELDEYPILLKITKSKDLALTIAKTFRESKFISTKIDEFILNKDIGIYEWEKTIEA